MGPSRQSAAEQKSPVERLKIKVDTYESQRAAARAAELAPSQLSYILSGTRRPTFDTALKMETAFGIPATDWFTTPTKRRRKSAA